MRKRHGSSDGQSVKETGWHMRDGKPHATAFNGNQCQGDHFHKNDVTPGSFFLFSIPGKTWRDAGENARTAGSDSKWIYIQKGLKQWQQRSLANVRKQRGKTAREQLRLERGQVMGGSARNKR